MTPDKKKRARAAAEEWARTDPGMQRLRELIERYRILNAQKRRASS
jgi:hypothetical protein